MEQTNIRTRQLFPWARTCRAPLEVSWWSLWAQKSRFRVRFHFLWVIFGVLVTPWKIHFFMILSHLAAPRGTPGGVRSMFRRVFGSIWSKRISTQGSFSLGANAGGHCLGPHGGLLRLRQVVFGSYFIFLGSILEFWWHPGKVIFSWFLALLGVSRGFPGGPEMPILAAF